MSRTEVNLAVYRCELRDGSEPSVRIYGYDIRGGIIGWHIKPREQIKRPLYGENYKGEREPSQPITQVDIELFWAATEIAKSLRRV